MSETKRALRGLVAAFGISSIGFGILTPFLVVWGRADAGMSGATAGLLFMAQAAGEVVGGLGGGLLADRIGGRQILLVSTAGMALGYASLGLVTTPAAAVTVIFVAGLFEAAFHPTAFALIGDLSPQDNRRHAFGVIRTAGNVGTVLGPLAGAAVVAGLPLATIFFVSGALLAASGLVVLATLPRRGLQISLEEEREELQAAVPGIMAIARDRRLAMLVAGGTLLTITWAWWESDGLAVLHTQRPFGTGSFALMLTLSAALTIAFQIPVTRASRSRSTGALLTAGALLQGLGLAALAAASLSPAVVVAAVALSAFGQMLYGPSLNAVVSTIAPRGRGATYQAALSTTADIGMAAGPASGLALTAALGAPLMWLLALPAGMLAAAATTRAARKEAHSADGALPASELAPPRPTLPSTM